MNLDKDYWAYQSRTIPKYIYSIGDKPLSFVFELGNYQIIRAGKFYSPIEFYNEQNNLAAVKLNLTYEEILVPFSIFNESYRRLIFDQFKNNILLLETLQIPLDEIREYYYVWNNLSTLGKAYELEVDEFRRVYETKLAQTEQLNNVESFTADEYKLISKNQVFTFEKDATLMDIFNDLYLDAELPLVTGFKFYKVLEGFNYALETPEDANTLFLFYKGEKLSLKFTGDCAKPLFEITLPAENLADIKTRLGAKNVKIINEKLNVSINFNHPNFEPFDFNKSIWSDLIMNNSTISENFVIDEHLKIFKTSSVIYMYFFTNKKAKIPFTVRAVNEYISLTQFTTTVSVKLMNCDIEEIQVFSKYISSILGVYYESAKDIAEEYNQYLSVPIKLIKPKGGDKKPRLKDIEPDLFVAGYKRSCGFPPTIIDRKDVKTYEEKGYKIMLYPKGENEGLRPRFYVCLDKGYIYPGLRENNLPNRSKYRYLPCCYKEDQLAKNTIYKKYIFEEKELDEPEEEKRLGHLKTEKILQKDQTGDLPPKLKRLFGLIDVSNKLIQRRGVQRSSASILECISKNDAAKERAKLSSARDQFLITASQELSSFGGNLEKAREILRNKNEYLDPRLFFTLLERMYNCRLILLSRDDFVYPQHSSTFASFPSNGEIIVLYENFGGSSEYQVIPQWEIVENIRNKQLLYEYYSTFKDRYKVDLFGHIERIYLEEEEKINWGGKVVSQILNSYGQAIALNVKTPPQQTLKTFRLAYPIAPLEIPRTDDVYPTAILEVIKKLPIEYDGAFYYLLNASSITSTYSWMKEFADIRKKSKFLIEQAKYIRSKGGQINLGTLDIKVTDKWVSNMSAPENIRRKLNYAVDIFKKFSPEEFQNYKTFKIVPNRYNYIDDFKNRSGEIIVSSGLELEWLDISNTIDKFPRESAFFIELASKLYHCVPAEINQQTNLNVCVFNTRKIFRIGNPEDKKVSFLIYKNKSKISTFKCFVVSS